MSTDCVFSGRKGYYSEKDPSDAEDLYGKTKYLGEIDYPGALPSAHPLSAENLILPMASLNGS